MKTVLFCQNPYAFGILEPIMQVLKQKKYEYLWFVKENIKEKFPFKNEPFTDKITTVISFNSDAIFVPGNEVPYYLRGVKTQVFHGLAGEKKGHFRIRHYFDLYLTQGPYFTKRFLELRKKYQNFEVVETGWPKLDIYGKEKNKYHIEKNKLLKKHSAQKMVLYAPTFSPSLTSIPYLLDEFKLLAKDKKYLILMKFHDLTNPDLIKTYKKLASQYDNILFMEEKNIIKFLLMSDIMISDTSSVVYEFLLLDKPVITYKNSAKNIRWDNVSLYKDLPFHVAENLNKDPYKKERVLINQEYHPYSDGKSALRMVEAVEEYIKKNGIPNKRKLSWLRRRKIHKIFGKV